MVAMVTDNGPIQPLPISWKVTGNGVMVAMVEQLKDGGYNLLYKKTTVDSEYL